MSALHVPLALTSDPFRRNAVGRAVIDSDLTGVVNLDFSHAEPQADYGPDDDDPNRWVSMTVGEARALAAALLHYAQEAER